MNKRGDLSHLSFLAHGDRLTDENAASTTSAASAWRSDDVKMADVVDYLQYAKRHHHVCPELTDESDPNLLTDVAE